MEERLNEMHIINTLAATIYSFSTSSEDTTLYYVLQIDDRDPENIYFRFMPHPRYKYNGRRYTADISHPNNTARRSRLAERINPNKWLDAIKDADERIRAEATHTAIITMID